MNRGIYRVLSVLLAVALLAALGLTAFAEAVPELPDPVPEETSPSPETAVEPSPEEPSGGAGELPESGGIELTQRPVPMLESASTALSGAREFYIASYGSDETGDGNREAPFATLARAAAAANGADTYTVYLVLLTDLNCGRTARFFDHEIILVSDDTPCRVTRTAEFLADSDAVRGLYNPALIECGRVEGTDHSPARLVIENVTLDDFGAHMGTDYSEAVRTSGERENRDRVQDGIVAAYDAGASIALTAGAELLNYGGLAAAYLDGGATLILEEGSRIADTLALPRPECGGAILLHGGAEATVSEYATVIERAAPTPPPTPEIPEESPEATPEATPVATPEATPEASPETAPTTASTTAPTATPAETPAQTQSPTEAEEIEPDGVVLLGFLRKSKAAPRALGDVNLGGAVSLTFASTQEGLTRFEDSELSLHGFAYDVDYALTLALSDTVKELMNGIPGSVTAEGTITLTLDGRLAAMIGESNPALTSSAFETNGAASLSGSVLTVPIRLRNDWVSENSAALTLHTTLPSTEFREGEKLSSTAEISLTLHTGNGDYPITSAPQTAETKMLGLPTVTLSYDPNGGSGAPAAQRVSPQSDYALDSTTVPTHEADGIGPVVFIGWTESWDGHIYLRGETPPDTVETVEIPEPSQLQPFASKTVYAVYGYDENSDGTADVLQHFLTLYYDPNGGIGAPEAESKLSETLAGGARFDISPTEPTREHFTFQGWAEEPNASEAKYKYDAEHAADRDLLIHQDTTLYVVWKENPFYTLYFNANGGSNPPAALSGYADTVENGVNVLRLTLPQEKPTRTGHSFVGWSPTRGGNANYLPGDEVKISGGNVMLYAVWQRSASGGRSGYGGGAHSPSPKTGDSNNPLLYVLLAIASLAALSAVSVLLIKRGRKKKRPPQRRERR